MQVLCRNIGFRRNNGFLTLAFRLIANDFAPFLEKGLPHEIFNLFLLDRNTDG